MKKAYLLLADGTLFEGVSVGAEGASIAEIVFNTGMAGYQEVLTDPSYYGQSVCMTYPLIGNYGLNAEDFESRKCWVSGFIMREACAYPSNWRCDRSLDEYLKSEGIVGLAGIDTRRLTRILRNSGVMNGILYSEGYEPTEQQIAEMKAYKVTNAVKTVTISEPKVYPTTAETQKHRVALLDFGVKRNIRRELCARGCEVTVLPAYTKPEDILNGGYDGIMLSNGPGDPQENTEIIENLKVLTKSGMPIFGICLGHQLLALSIGAQTKKMTFGHRSRIWHTTAPISPARTTATLCWARPSIRTLPASATSTSTTIPVKASSICMRRSSPFSIIRRSSRVRRTRHICSISLSHSWMRRKEALSNAAAQRYS